MCIRDRYVIRNQPYDVHDRSDMIRYCMYTTNCEVCHTKSSRNSRTCRKNELAWCDTVCIPRTASYLVPNQAETAEDAESTSEHQRIQQYAMFRFNSWRRNDTYTTNCEVCDTNYSKQQKMPKARANINAYSSTRCSGLILENEMICTPRTARYVIRIKANSRRCQKHERTSTYTAVREFPV